MIAKPDVAIVFSSNKIGQWNYKLKKLLLFHLNLVTSERETFTTHLRMLDMFTSDMTFTKYVPRDKVVELLYGVSKKFSFLNTLLNLAYAYL